MTPPAAAPTAVTFYLDPGCPWTWLSAGWLVDVAAQRGVVSARRVEEARALRPLAVERALEYAHGLRLSRRVEPRGGRRHGSRSSCRSQARAAVHARLTEAVEMSSASAVCSMVKPAK